MKRFRARRPIAEVLRRPNERRSVLALDEVSGFVEEGSLHALLGQNGAGKSTLFRILSTLLLPDEGSAEVFGEDVVLDAEEARVLVSGASTDERSLNWRLSSVENLRLFAALYDIPRRETERRISEMLNVVGLDDVAGRMAGQLSSGLRQRLLVARALLPRPRLLLLDEPTRSLDPLTARDLRSFLREELVGRMGMTIMLATHDAEEALSLSDRVSVLHRGRLVAEGAPAALSAELQLNRMRLVCRAEDMPVAMREAGVEGAGAGGAGAGGAGAEGEGARAESGALRSGLGLPAVVPAQSMAPHAAVESGWIVLDIPSPGSTAGEAALLKRLTRAGVVAARLERVPPSLAELLQRAIARADGERSLSNGGRG
ncbi:MAG TPA: ABC transporter ATP-binding protein [Gemmatimonadales bacterium]|nr:ABC transporter ATP-binding protein [Gemmatimonadales bacterium]